MFTIYLIQYNANTAFPMVAAAFRAQSWYIRELVSKFVSMGVGSWVSEHTPSVYVDVIDMLISTIITLFSTLYLSQM